MSRTAIQKRFKRWLPRFAALLVLAVLLIVRHWDPLPIEVMRLRTFDVYQNVDPRARGDSPVAVIDIDEASLQAEGQWPWPRTKIAALIERAFAGGARAVTFDIVFAEPDRLSPPRLAEMVEQYDADLARRLEKLPTNDSALAGIMRDSGRVVLAQAAAHRRLADDLGPVYQPSVAELGADPGPHLISAPAMIRNVPVLADAAAGVGVISLWPSVDSVVRKVPLFIQVNGRPYPSLALELMRAGRDAKSYVIESSAAGIERVLLGNERITATARGEYWVRYGKSRTDAFLSATDVLSGNIPRERLAGKLVLVGTSATGLGDIKATPVDGAVPGVEVHAQIVESILGQESLTRPAGAKLAEMLATAGVALVIIFLTPKFGALRVLLLGGVLASAVLGISIYGFLGRNLLIDPSFPLVANLVLFGYIVVSNYIAEEREKVFIRRAFSQYLSPSMVENLSQNPGMLSLGGETRDLSVLFCDLRGFTRISEQLADDPQALTALINRFLTPLSEVILHHQGTIDKYIGDAIMAFWNAPLDDPEHRRNAVRAALGMARALAVLNQTLEQEARDAGTEAVKLRVGIGINSGSCVAGNLGSQIRFSYSAIGDPVNLAARLEGLTRLYGIDVLVAQKTAEACADFALLLPLDRVRVKGKTQPERIYGVIGDRSEAAVARDFDDLKEPHEAMLARSENGDYAGAEADLERATVHYDRLGLREFREFYAARIRELKAKRFVPGESDVFDPQGKSF